LVATYEAPHIRDISTALGSSLTMMESPPGALSATARSLMVDVMVVDVMEIVEVMVVEVVVVDVMGIVEVMVVEVAVVDVMEIVEVTVVDVMVVDVMVVDVMVVDVMVVVVMVMADVMVVNVMVKVVAHPPPILAQGVDSGRSPSLSAVLPVGPAAVHAPPGAHRPGRTLSAT
jgi:hypothetical protein